MKSELLQYFLPDVWHTSTQDFYSNIVRRTLYRRSDTYELFQHLIINFEITIKYTKNLFWFQIKLFNWIICLILLNYFKLLFHIEFTIKSSILTHKVSTSYSLVIIHFHFSLIFFFSENTFQLQNLVGLLHFYEI